MEKLSPEKKKARLGEAEDELKPNEDRQAALSSQASQVPAPKSGKKPAEAVYILSACICTCHILQI